MNKINLYAILSFGFLGLASHAMAQNPEQPGPPPADALFSQERACLQALDRFSGAALEGHSSVASANFAVEYGNDTLQMMSVYHNNRLMISTPTGAYVTPVRSETVPQVAHDARTNGPPSQDRLPLLYHFEIPGARTHLPPLPGVVDQNGNAVACQDPRVSVLVGVESPGTHGPQAFLYTAAEHRPLARLIGLGYVIPDASPCTASYQQVNSSLEYATLLNTATRDRHGGFVPMPNLQSAHDMVRDSINERVSRILSIMRARVAQNRPNPANALLNTRHPLSFFQSCKNIPGVDGHFMAFQQDAGVYARLVQNNQATNAEVAAYLATHNRGVLRERVTAGAPPVPRPGRQPSAQGNQPQVDPLPRIRLQRLSQDPHDFDVDTIGVFPVREQPPAAPNGAGSSIAD